MKKDAFTSPTQRSIAYFITFVLGVAVLEIIRPLLPWGFILPSLVFIVIFTLTGVFLIHNHTIPSRIASSSTMFILGIVAIGFGTRGFSNACNLLLALAIAWLGGIPFFHGKHKTGVSTSLLNAGIIVIAIVSAVMYLLLANWLMRLALANVHYCL